MDQVTAISIILILMMLLLPVIARRMQHRAHTLRIGRYTLLAVYLLVNLYLTLLSRTPRPYSTAEWIPFWSYAETLRGNASLGVQIILNILLYIPFGYLLRFTFPHLQPRRVILLGFILSVLTELTQLIFHLGLFEFDDMIDNTLGACIGVGCDALIRRLFPCVSDQASR